MHLFDSQVNVELLTIDKRTFTTDEGNSLQTLFGENSEGSAQYRAELSTMAARLATVFASLKVSMQPCTSASHTPEDDAKTACVTVSGARHVRSHAITASATYNRLGHVRRSTTTMHCIISWCFSSYVKSSRL